MRKTTAPKRDLRMAEEEEKWREKANNREKRNKITELAVQVRNKEESTMLEHKVCAHPYKRKREEEHPSDVTATEISDNAHTFKESLDSFLLRSLHRLLHNPSDTVHHALDMKEAIIRDEGQLKRLIAGTTQNVPLSHGTSITYVVRFVIKAIAYLRQPISDVFRFYHDCILSF